jgi:hypothetical protein
LRILAFARTAPDTWRKLAKPLGGILGSLVIFGLVATIMVTFGCTLPPQPPGELQYLSAGQVELWADKFDGKYVDVYGGLQAGDVLFFRGSEHIIYVLPVYRDEDFSDADLLITGCENKLVRVFGRFEKLATSEYQMSGVYLMIWMDRRAAGPGDIICWSNSAADPHNATSWQNTVPPNTYEAPVSQEAQESGTGNQSGQ